MYFVPTEDEVVLQGIVVVSIVTIVETVCVVILFPYGAPVVDVSRALPQ